MTGTPFDNPNVEQVFAEYPEEARNGLFQLRQLIFDVAARTEAVGKLEETLKWGQPAYLTPETKSGSTIRLGLTKTDKIAIYTHCQTSLIADFQTLFPDDFIYEGNRAIHFETHATLPVEKLELFIKSALTYHRR